MRKKPTPKRRKPFISIWAALAIVLLWSLAGCKTPPERPLSGPARSVQLPPLPTYARQPATPSACLPTCLDGLTRERTSWQTLLTGDTLPAAPASASTTRPGPK